MADIADAEKGMNQIAMFLVIFSHPLDEETPKDWPVPRKWAVTGVLSATGFNRIIVSMIMAPALPTIARELHTSNVESVMAMTVYLLASAFGPLSSGPLSDVFGRKPVLHITKVWLLIWNIVCGIADSKALLIAARLLAALGASAIYALCRSLAGPPPRRMSLTHTQSIPGVRRRSY